LTDGAKGFAKAIRYMKERGDWPAVRHLLCRWHVYEAIKRHCAQYFKSYPKGTQQAAMNRFIEAFRNVVCASTMEEMRAAWNSKIECGQFPSEAIAHVKKEYYASPKAEKIMECFVWDSGNLHQTTTSRNEGSHAAYRSKIPVIPKLAESYKQRRIHKMQWLQRLRSTAMNARNRIPLDIQRVPELSRLAGKVSIFALTKIKEELILSKKDESEGILHSRLDLCNCHTHNRYKLSCKHMLPIDGTAIDLDIIPSFWRLDNWDQGMIQFDSYTNL
jgi:hypothetical protein